MGGSSKGVQGGESGASIAQRDDAWLQKLAFEEIAENAITVPIATGAPGPTSSLS